MSGIKEHCNTAVIRLQLAELVSVKADVTGHRAICLAYKLYTEKAVVLHADFRHTYHVRSHSPRHAGFATVKSTLLKFLAAVSTPSVQQPVNITCQT